MRKRPVTGCMDWWMEGDSCNSCQAIRDSWKKLFLFRGLLFLSFLRCLKKPTLSSKRHRSVAVDEWIVVDFWTCPTPVRSDRRLDCGQPMGLTEAEAPSRIGSVQFRSTGGRVRRLALSSAQAMWGVSLLIRRHSGVELGGRFHTPMLVELGAVPHVLCRTLRAWSALQHHRILHGLQHRLAPNLHAAAEHGRLSHTEHTEPLASQTPRTWMWKAKQKTFWITPSSLCEPSREPPKGSSGQLMVGGRRPGGPQPGGRGRADHRWAG